MKNFFAFFFINLCYGLQTNILPHQKKENVLQALTQLYLEIKKCREEE